MKGNGAFPASLTPVTEAPIPDVEQISVIPLTLYQDQIDNALNPTNFPHGWYYYMFVGDVW
jgi:hypothetical protein